MVKIIIFFIVSGVAWASDTEFNLSQANNLVENFLTANKAAIDAEKPSHFGNTAVATLGLIKDRLTAGDPNHELKKLAIAIVLGYGFHDGVDPRINLTPYQQDQYQKIVREIGRHIHKDSQKLTRVFIISPFGSDSATDPEKRSKALKKHLEIANKLLFQSADPAAPKFGLTSTPVVAAPPPAPPAAALDTTGVPSDSLKQAAHAPLANIDPIFKNSDIIAEYKTLALPLTLAVSSADAALAESLRELPHITIREQTLGYNSWPCSFCGPNSARAFHDNAQTWDDAKFNDYFKNGILREIIFLLTGVGDKGIVDPVVDRRWSNDEIAGAVASGYFTEKAVSRVILSLFHEMNPQTSREKLLGFTYNKISRSLFKNSEKILIFASSKIPHDATEFKEKFPRYSTEDISPKNYENYQFWIDDDSRSKLSADDQHKIAWLAANVEHVMLQMIDILSTDPLVLNLAKKFHMQKLIEERLNGRQHDRMLGTLTDGKFDIIGPAFGREQNLANVTNRALFHLIKEKVKKAIELYILPIPDVSDFDPATMPTVDAAGIHGVTPGFISNEAIQKILQAAYVPVG